MIPTIDLLFGLVDEERKSLIMMMSINFIFTIVILMQIVRLVEEERESLHSSLSEALTYLCSLGSTSPCSTRYHRYCNHCHNNKDCLWSGSNEYSRVLDYSIFKSLLVPYSENFTTRPSSRVVAIFTFLVRIIQISKKMENGHFCDDLMYHPQQCLSPFIMEFMN